MTKKLRGEINFTINSKLKQIDIYMYKQVPEKSII